MSIFNRVILCLIHFVEVEPLWSKRMNSVCMPLVLTFQRFNAFIGNAKVGGYNLTHLYEECQKIYGCAQKFCCYIWDT